MSSATLPLKMPKRVIRKVRSLRWLVRLYVGVEGLASVALVLGIAFWAGLWIDWAFEPSPQLRILLWAAVLLATCYVAVRYLFSRAIARLPNTSLALLLERNYPELKESLVTTVEAAERRRVAPLGDKSLLEQTSQTASAAMGGIQLSRIFRFRPLIWKSCVAIALVGSVVAFAFLQTETFGFWLQRLQLSSAPWPRLVQLSVVGFEERDGELVATVARDGDFQLQTYASILGEHSAPEQIEIRYRLADGRRGRHSMTRVGEALPGRDASQGFQYSFNKVADDLWFDIVGGDDRIRSLRLHVVERPQIVGTAIECEYPAYMQRSALSKSFSGRVELPEGAQAVCRVETNQMLSEVTVHEPAHQHDLPTTIDTGNSQTFSFALDIGIEDRVLLLTMRSREGIENREPYRIVVSAVRDEPPEVSVRVRGISSAVTPQATIPFVGSVLDSYGVEEVWFEYQVDQEKRERRIPSFQPQGRLAVTQFEPFDLGQADPESRSRLVDLQPGQKLSLAVQARDAYDLHGEPHIGSSQRFMLDIVTESELRAQLEKRELGLRQRFEAIHEKMTGIQVLVTRIQVEQPFTDQQPDTENPDTENPDTENPDAGEQERLRERDRLRIGGALQNVTQIAYETLGVSEGFEDIVEELINNRVVTEELKRRLIKGIAEPLREIGEKMLPTLEEKIQVLQTAFTNQQSLEQAHRLTVVQGEAILEAMQQVMNRMLELESYNELVELLRGIVSEHGQLQEQTRAERRKKLRSLLDEE